MQASDPLVVTESRRIEARPDEVFALLADPQRHPEFDGSGMLRGSDAGPVTGVSDSFVMQMFYEQFGDYQMLNRVVEFEPSRRIAWAPTRIDSDDDDWQHRWGFDLEPDGDGTVVTEFYDCTRVPDEGREILKDGQVWAEAMHKSLERLEELAGSSKG
jgi:uncharacterized protein YndB with AHSA1/START domain